MKYILSFILLFTFGMLTQAQIQPCAAATMEKSVFKRYPQLKQQSKLYRQHIHALMDMAKTDPNDTVTYIIPIVFHVLHQYGPGNISDQQIFDAVDIINKDFQKLNADTSEIVPELYPTLGNAHIKFELATLDPNGNPTNGITRRYTNDLFTVSDTNNYDVTKYDDWPNSDYLNVWVVNNLGGSLAGAVYHPSAVVGPLSIADGVIILNSEVGSIGTSNSWNARALTHFIGHYLGLNHVWGNSDSPDIIANCAIDDGLADTPNCMGSIVGVCDLSRSTCGDSLVDPVQNFMEYSYCTVMFSKDQVEFMRTVLQQSVAHRNNLWTPTNLSKTVPEGVEVGPVADFYVKNTDPSAENQNNPFACQGEAVHFINASWRLADSNATYSWTFQDATPATSTAENPTVVFNSPGWKDVSLIVTDAGKSDTLIRHNFMYVEQDWPLFNGVHQFDFDAHPSWWVIWNPMNLDYQWQVKSGTGINGTNGMFLKMATPYISPAYLSPEYLINARRQGTRSSFITKPMDFSYVTNPTLTFHWACATSGTTPNEISEKVEVYVSYNCGAKWYPITGDDASSSVSGEDLINNGSMTSSFMPNGSSNWSSKTFNVISTVAGKNHVQVKFVYVGSGHSNNIAIDNINIDGTLGINAPQLNDHISVYPNPSTKADGWNIKYDANEWSGAKVKLLDMSGRIVSEGTLPNNQSKWNLKAKANLTNGVYILKIQNNRHATQKKLILK